LVSSLPLRRRGQWWYGKAIGPHFLVVVVCEVKGILTQAFNLHGVFARKVANISAWACFPDRVGWCVSAAHQPQRGGEHHACHEKKHVHAYKGWLIARARWTRLVEAVKKGYHGGALGAGCAGDALIFGQGAQVAQVRARGAVLHRLRNAHMHVLCPGIRWTGDAAVVVRRDQAGVAVVEEAARHIVRRGRPRACGTGNATILKGPVAKGIGAEVLSGPAHVAHAIIIIIIILLIIIIIVDHHCGMGKE
jgi:hypothetical protein